MSSVFFIDLLIERWFPIAATPETTKGEHRSHYYSALNIIAQKKDPHNVRVFLSSDLCRDRTKSDLKHIYNQNVNLAPSLAPQSTMLSPEASSPLVAPESSP